MKGFGIAIAAFGIVGGAQAFSLYTFESLAGTSGGALTSLSQTDEGLTMTLTRTSGAAFDVLNTTPFRGTSFQFPLQWRNRVLDPFANQSIDDWFIADFSTPVTAFEFEYGDFGADSDQAVLEVWSGPNATGTLITTVTSDFLTRRIPSYDALGWNNAGNSAVAAQSFKFRAGSANFQNSVYYDNFAAEAVPEPATLAILGLGLAAFARRRKSA